MEVRANHLNGVLELGLRRFHDDRGYFEEVFRSSTVQELGIAVPFVQDNHSHSKRNVIRGLHYQHTPPMGKLLLCLHGAIQLVELDIRKNSPTYLHHVSIMLSADDPAAVWIPPGFANGFAVLSDTAHVLYKCTAEYNPSGEEGINPLDPAVNIAWMVTNPILSEKDRQAPDAAGRMFPGVDR